MHHDQRHACQVSVDVSFMREHSDIMQNSYVFAYQITIRNIGKVAVQLISRHWIIVNAHHDRQEVQGLGVVGEQPVIQPDSQFTYCSHTVISTPTGSMYGTYQMMADDGTVFDAVISPFILAMPRVLH